MDTDNKHEFILNGIETNFCIHCGISPNLLEDIILKSGEHKCSFREYREHLFDNGTIRYQSMCEKCFLFEEDIKIRYINFGGKCFKSNSGVKFLRIGCQYSEDEWEIRKILK